MKGLYAEFQRADIITRIGAMSKNVQASARGCRRVLLRLAMSELYGYGEREWKGPGSPEYSDGILIATSGRFTDLHVEPCHIWFVTHSVIGLHRTELEELDDTSVFELLSFVEKELNSLSNSNPTVTTP